MSTVLTVKTGGDAAVVVWVNVAVSVITSGVVSALVAGLFRQRGARLNRRNERLLAVRQALKDLEDTYTGVGAGTSESTEILTLESAFKQMVDSCADTRLLAPADSLLDVGARFAAGDEDVSVEAFRDAVDALRSVIRERLAKLN